MNERFKTDFLIPSSSFLTGLGSVFCIGGHLYQYNTSDNPDEIAIANDWLMVGQDIHDAMAEADAEGIAACDERKTN
jgi:hypothetical protein